MKILPSKEMLIPGMVVAFIAILVYNKVPFVRRAIKGPDAV